jgi:hypothetical protein
MMIASSSALVGIPGSLGHPCFNAREAAAKSPLGRYEKGNVPCELRLDTPRLKDAARGWPDEHTPDLNADGPRKARWSSSDAFSRG